jgi:hypothetical protein
MAILFEAKGSAAEVPLECESRAFALGRRFWGANTTQSGSSALHSKGSLYDRTYAVGDNFELTDRMSVLRFWFQLRKSYMIQETHQVN